MMISVWNSRQGPGCAAAAMALPGRRGCVFQITVSLFTEAVDPEGNELGGDEPSAGALGAEALGGIVKGRGAAVAVLVEGLASFQMTPFLSGTPALAEGEGAGVAAGGAEDGADDEGPSFHMMPFLSGAPVLGPGALLDGALAEGDDDPAVSGLLQIMVPSGVGLDWAKAAVPEIRPEIRVAPITAA